MSDTDKSESTNKELREAIGHIPLRLPENAITRYYTLGDEELDQIMQLIQQQCNQARIDELERAMSGYSWIEWRRLKELKLKDGTKTPLAYIEQRLSELQAQAKETETE
jgi:hypothetical protein